MHIGEQSILNRFFFRSGRVLLRRRRVWPEDEGVEVPNEVEEADQERKSEGGVDRIPEKEGIEDGHLVCQQDNQ